MTTARLVAEALRDSPQAASLLARCEASRRAAEAIAPVYRGLTGLNLSFDALTPGVCELRGETLWLTLPSPSHVAKVRQVLPRLLSALAADGVAVYEIKTRVQPAVTSYPTEGTGGVSSYSTSELAWPANSRTAATAVAELTGQLHDSPLKEAVRRLGATLRGRISQQIKEK